MADNGIRLQEGQSVIGTSTSKVVNRNWNRRALLITNAGANALYIGTKDSLSIGTGHYIGTGSSIATAYQGDIYMIAAVGGTTATWLEESNA